MTHARYATVQGLRMHFVVAGSGDPVLLLHGFPQTWYEWRHTIAALAARYTVIAPDYRGAGDTARPPTGYDKHTMMEDMRALVQQLGFRELRIVGHDIGAMIGYRYAAVYPQEVRQLVLMDAPVPGTRAMTEIRANPRAWHVNFFSVRDIPEMLIAGREREFLTYFFKSRYARPQAIAQEDLAVYIEAYAAPGALHAGLEVYRAWDQDAQDNRPYLARKLQMPVLVVAAGMSVTAGLLEEMTADIAQGGRFELVEGAGHWLPEESAQRTCELLAEFLG